MCAAARVRRWFLLLRTTGARMPQTTTTFPLIETTHTTTSRFKPLKHAFPSLNATLFSLCSRACPPPPSHPRSLHPAHLDDGTEKDARAAPSPSFPSFPLSSFSFPPFLLLPFSSLVLVSFSGSPLLQTTTHRVVCVLRHASAGGSYYYEPPAPACRRLLLHFR